MFWLVTGEVQLTTCHRIELKRCTSKNSSFYPGKKRLQSLETASPTTIGWSPRIVFSPDYIMKGQSGGTLKGTLEAQKHTVRLQKTFFSNL